jgi:hypothetical protein
LVRASAEGWRSSYVRAPPNLDDDRYPYSWLPPEDAHAEASELAERRPEAFPE